MTDSTNKNIQVKEIDNQQSGREFFNCDLCEILPFFKDDIVSMEHPVFSLTTQSDKRVLHYQHNGNSIRIIPSVLGLPTIHDKDILIYCASHLRAAITRGDVPSRTVRFTVHHFLTSIGRDTGGDSYERFRDSLNRLRGVTIHTHIKTGKVRIEEGFGLIDVWRAVKEDNTSRVIAVEIDLSNWLYNAILSNELLTINPDYFQLRKPMERRLYEIGRKHCGSQKIFKIGLDKLHIKMGTKAPLRKLRAQVRKIILDDHIPDYEIYLSDNDIVTFSRKIWILNASINRQKALSFLKPETYEKARAVAPGWDIYELERQWREWVAKKKEPPKRPDAAFVAFCRKKFQQEGQ